MEKIKDLWICCEARSSNENYGPSCIAWKPKLNELKEIEDIQRDLKSWRHTHHKAGKVTWPVNDICLLDPDEETDCKVAAGLSEHLATGGPFLVDDIDFHSSLGWSKERYSAEFEHVKIKEERVSAAAIIRHTSIEIHMAFFDSTWLQAHVINLPNIWEDTCLHPGVIADVVCAKYKVQSQIEAVIDKIETMWRDNAEFRKTLNACVHGQDGDAEGARDWLYEQVGRWIISGQI